MQMKCYIIVLQWNNSTDTLECLASLEKIRTPGVEILVVDNGSTDGSLKRVQAAYPHLSYLDNGANLGYAEGNNRGIEIALEKGADFLLLLNNDTYVASNLIDAFLEAASLHPEAGAFGAKIYFHDEPATIWHAGGDVNLQTLRCGHLGNGDADSDKKHEEIRRVNYLCGCALFIRAEALKKVGLFDAQFFLLWEEIDWCFRLRKAGYSCLFVPKARLWHKISASFPEGNRGPVWQYYYFRNRLLFAKRHQTKRERIEFYKKHLIWELLDMFKVLLHPKTPKLQRRQNQAALKGVIYYFINK